MFETIKNLILEHLKLLDDLIITSERIFSHAQNANLALLVSESNNRDRLVNILASHQEKIARLIETFRSVDEQERNELIRLCHSWQQEMQIKVEKINEFDQLILNHLDEHKMQTLKDILSLHQSKEKFKGYNLHNVLR